jgi:anaerobic selenocysteine-containing dehydrogenase
VTELQFQRPAPELELSQEDARSRGIENDAEVEVSSNGSSARLRARVSRKLPKGTVRAAEEHVRGLAHDVEVKPA